MSIRGVVTSTIGSTILWILLVGSTVWGGISLVGSLRDRAEVVQLEALRDSRELGRTDSLTVRSAAAARILADFEFTAARELVSAHDPLLFSRVCLGLSHLGTAITLDPENPALLAQWARVRSALGAHTCSLEGTEGSAEKYARTALQLDPFGAETLFEAGWALVLLAKEGSRRESFAPWRSLLSIRGLEPQQVRVMLGTIRSAEELLWILPDHFPNAVRFLEFVHRDNPEEFREVVEGKFREKTIEKLEGLLSAWEQERDVWRGADRSWLWRAVWLGDLRRLRRSLFSVLSRTASKGDSAQRELFLALSELDEVPQLIGHIQPNSRPLEGSLAGWNSDRGFTLDDYYRSIGAFVQKGSRSSVLLLRATKQDDLLKAERLGLYVSNDNSRWRKIEREEGSAVHSIQFTISGEQIVAFLLPDRRERYLKVHYAESLRPQHFRYFQRRMLSVFGVPSGGRT